MLLLKPFDSRKVLQAFSPGAVASLTVVPFDAGPTAKLAFPLPGFCASVMWPIIISLGLNSVAGCHGPLVGILFAGVMSGAVVSLIIGGIGDWLDLRTG